MARCFTTLIIASTVASLLLCACSSRNKYNEVTEYADIAFIAFADSMQELLEIAADTLPQISRNKKFAAGYRRTFNDMNDVHIAAAKLQGIAPLRSLTAADSAGFWSLARVDSCEYYTIEKLTHSAPYLTPRAKWLLMTIGKNFIDSLAAHDVTGYQIIVTSLLRTDESIRRLRRRNSNASENSAHRYGTTFDIAYVHYNHTDTTTFMPEYRLKETLAEVLYDLRAQGRCYVKYEVRQGCFHITAR